MKTFVEYIKNYFREDFKWLPHLIIGIFLAISIWINYSYDLFHTILLAEYKTWLSVVYLLGFYALPFLFAATTVSVFGSTHKPILNSNFLIFGLIGLLFIALDNSYYIMAFTDEIMPNDYYIRLWAASCLSNLSSFLTVIIPLYLLYFLVKHFKPELYGLRLNGAKVLPYFWLILFMIPLIYLASFRPDFLDTYPTYTDNFEYKFLETDQWVTAGIYELCYGFDFLSVELIFRGFMVIALSRFVGKEAILPMVAVYCFLHFGKPMGETISSIFGGYILGILAYSSRNIYGGLIAHLGVAWGMEYLAYLQS